MRIFTNFVSTESTLLVESTAESAAEVLSRISEVLELSDADVSQYVLGSANLAPSDERAIDAALEFVENQPFGGSPGRGNALTINNMNTGRSLLLLSKFCYYG